MLTPKQFEQKIKAMSAAEIRNHGKPLPVITTENFQDKAVLDAYRELAAFQEGK